jgi:uncharacterized membrane protein
MIFALDFVATFCTGLFAGAALYITVVEHPARMECGTALAVTEFGPSYRRATVMQVSLAIAGFVAAIANWALTSKIVWLVGGMLVVLVIPFTLLVIIPTNKRLLDPSLDRNSDLARQLLIRWGRLHAIRTMLGLLAFVMFVSVTTPGLWRDAGRPTGDSLLGVRETVLRQDLFMLRSLISQYTLDNRKQPKSLGDLVKAGYLKQVPVDPVTGKPDWVVEWTRVTVGMDQQGPGIFDVHSGSSAIDSGGTAYNKW